MRLWDRIKAYKDKGYAMPDIDYHALSMFPPTGSGDRVDFQSLIKLGEMEDHLNEFSKLNPDFDLSRTNNLDTACKFIKRKMFWMRRGYKNDAAYRKVAEEYTPVLEKERRLTAIISNAAKANQARSFMDQYEEIAHYEGLMKVKQLSRDVNKFVRSQTETDAEFELDSWEGLNIKIAQDEGALSDGEDSNIQKYTSKVTDI